MSSLDKKYNIPPETVKELIKDGIISCSVARHYEIYSAYLQYKQTHPDAHPKDFAYEMSDKFKLMPETISKIIFGLSKK